MFIAALFSIAMIRKQPSTNGWIKKMWHIQIHTQIYILNVHIQTYIYHGLLLSHKNEQKSAICNNTDGLGEHYAK